MAKHRQPHFRTIHRANLEAEGKLEAFETRIREVMAERNQTYHQVEHEIMVEFGYKSADEERAKAQQREAANRLAYKKPGERFEDAVRTLPDNAPTRVEIDWIRAHPAMMRRARSATGDEHVILDHRDVLYTDHGPAPSKSAVTMLQNWCNKPQEFFKGLLAEQKKASGEGSQNAKTEEDISVEEIDRVLAEVRGHGDGTVQVP